jgi:DNA-binding transcriptional regulator LsrR (DeoR family)
MVFRAAAIISPATRLSLSWEDLQRLENVVAVIYGRNKLRAALGALRTGLLDALIIDERTAIAALDSDGGKDVPEP